MLNREEFKNHLVNDIIPFWKNLRDNEFGGYYGYMDYDLKTDKKAVKGCILNSRILWFFSNAYMVLRDTSLLDEAKHAYEFMKDHCLDKENGGIFWSMTYDGKPADTMKHTYNQAFAIYALSSYFDITHDSEALDYAYKIYNTIETKCKDEIGYLEALDINFNIISNEALSENGVMADRTMNTLLHVFEAYTELYRVTKDSKVEQKLIEIINTFADKVYNPSLNRQEVFFNNNWESIIDLHSYGHDIETAWLMDKGVDILGIPEIKEKMYPITKALTKKIYDVAFDGNSLANECEKGTVDERRIWWVQAESVLGFLNGYIRDNTKTEYLEAAEKQWKFIQEFVVDKREGSEWFWEVRKDGSPYEDRPIVEPWKCPYHNGRMCIEVMRRMNKKLVLPEGKKKVLTLSYDDEVTQDRRFVEIINKYGLKCTFNLNSGTFGIVGKCKHYKNGVTVDHIKIPREEAATLYKGHEIAVHTVNHPHLEDLSDDEVRREIKDDMIALSEIAGYEVNGMAYPFGYFDKRLMDIMSECGIIYSRTVEDTHNFDVPNDFLMWHPTINFGEEGFDELVDKFLEDSDSPKLFYIWGHTYEFDAYDSWDRFEEFCKKVSGRDDILYATNKEVYELCK